MPIYEYDCGACGTRFEELVFLTSRPKTVICPECKSGQVSKRLSLIAASANGEHGKSICLRRVHDQHLRGEPLAGREPAKNADGPGRCPGL